MASKVKAVPVSSVLGKGSKYKKQPTPKRTSIGGRHFPLNKHKRRQFGRNLYRGQGRP